MSDRKSNQESRDDRMNWSEHRRDDDFDKNEGETKRREEEREREEKSESLRQKENDERQREQVREEYRQMMRPMISPAQEKKEKELFFTDWNLKDKRIKHSDVTKKMEQIDSLVSLKELKESEWKTLFTNREIEKRFPFEIPKNLSDKVDNINKYIPFRVNYINDNRPKGFKNLNLHDKRICELELEIRYLENLIEKTKEYFLNQDPSTKSFEFLQKELVVPIKTMKESNILIVDVETSGTTKNDMILQIGIVSWNKETGEIEKVIDMLTKSDNFNIEVKDDCYWYKMNNTYSKEDFKQVPNTDWKRLTGLDPVTKQNRNLLEIMKSYPLTGFNVSFDKRFLLNAFGYKSDSDSCPFRIPFDLSKVSKYLFSGKSISVSEQNTYRLLFNNRNYEEEHLAFSDARDEAEILNQLYKLAQDRNLFNKIRDSQSNPAYSKSDVENFENTKFVLINGTIFGIDNLRIDEFPKIQKEFEELKMQNSRIEEINYSKQNERMESVKIQEYKKCMIIYCDENLDRDQIISLINRIEKSDNIPTILVSDVIEIEQKLNFNSEKLDKKSTRSILTLDINSFSNLVDTNKEYLMNIKKNLNDIKKQNNYLKNLELKSETKSISGKLASVLGLSEHEVLKMAIIESLKDLTKDYPDWVIPLNEVCPNSVKNLRMDLAFVLNKSQEQFRVQFFKKLRDLHIDWGHTDFGKSFEDFFHEFTNTDTIFIDLCRGVSFERIYEKIRKYPPGSAGRDVLMFVANDGCPDPQVYTYRVKDLDLEHNVTESKYEPLVKDIEKRVFIINFSAFLGLISPNIDYLKGFHEMHDRIKNLNLKWTDQKIFFEWEIPEGKNHYKEYFKKIEPLKTAIQMNSLQPFQTEEFTKLVIEREYHNIESHSTSLKQDQIKINSIFGYEKNPIFKESISYSKGVDQFISHLATPKEIDEYGNAIYRNKNNIIVRTVNTYGLDVDAIHYCHDSVVYGSNAATFTGFVSGISDYVSQHYDYTNNLVFTYHLDKDFKQCSSVHYVHFLDGRMKEFHGENEKLYYEYNQEPGVYITIYNQDQIIISKLDNNRTPLYKIASLDDISAEKNTALFFNTKVGFLNCFDRSISKNIEMYYEDNKIIGRYVQFINDENGNIKLQRLNALNIYNLNGGQPIIELDINGIKVVERDENNRFKYKIFEITEEKTGKQKGTGLRGHIRITVNYKMIIYGGIDTKISPFIEMKWENDKVIGRYIQFVKDENGSVSLKHLLAYNVYAPNGGLPLEKYNEYGIKIYERDQECKSPKYKICRINDRGRFKTSINSVAIEYSRFDPNLSNYVEMKWDFNSGKAIGRNVRFVKKDDVNYDLERFDSYNEYSINNGIPIRIVGDGQDKKVKYGIRPK